MKSKLSILNWILIGIAICQAVPLVVINDVTSIKLLSNKNFTIFNDEEKKY